MLQLLASAVICACTQLQFYLQYTFCCTCVYFTKHTHTHTHLQWAKLFSPQVWLEASTQIFFSLGVATGALIALSSYTKPHYNALTDSLIVCLINSATSIFSAIVVFSIIGFKAKQTNINLNEELVSVCVCACMRVYILVVCIRVCGSNALPAPTITCINMGIHTCS